MERPGLSEQNVLEGTPASNVCLWPVQTYSGSVEPASGTLKMRFEVRGIAERCEAMCAEIGSAPCVVSWRLGCNMDSMQRQPA